MSRRAADLALLFDRDLGLLRTEIEAYPDDRALWWVAPGIANSAGTLVLHLTGNLQHFVGACFGGTGYVRERDAEFADRGVPKGGLLDRIDAARAVVARTFAGMDDAVLDRPFEGKGPVALGDAPTGHALLVYMYGHFAYHLGQVNYHRRLLAGAVPEA